MKLSFVIPAYNEEGYIGSCLDAIVAQKRALPDYDIEIVVVNNASTDSTSNIVKKYPDVKLVNEERKGIVWARRAGYMAATGDLIANVDADTRIPPDWIKTVMTEFAKDKNLVALSGPFIYYDLSPLVRFFTKIHYAIGYTIYHVFGIGAMLQGGNFIVRRDALEKIGGYDTRIEFYGEDTDIARRMSKVGEVKFTFRLPMYTSGRRLAKEGELATGFRYAINFFWITVFKKPFTKSYKDVRPEDKNAAAPESASKAKEWLTAVIFIIVVLAILACVAYIIYRLVRLG